MHAYRTHTCGELRAADAGAKVRLSGWVHRKRDHGGLLFIDLRDHYGLTQLVADPAFARLSRRRSRLRAESVIRVDGEVVARTAETVNPNLPTGEVEVQVIELRGAVGGAAELPLPVFGEPDYPEDIAPQATASSTCAARQLHRNIMLRSQVIASIRRRMIEQGFTEFQTPILTASSPEGARDFLVPSRLHPGKFYALPQAPQQFKQLLMVAGLRPLLPDRALLPRRGRARRPLAGRVLPARHRDELRRAGGRVRGDRAGHARRLRGVRRGQARSRRRRSRASPIARRC